jgi:hypothetical protein
MKNRFLLQKRHPPPHLQRPNDAERMPETFLPGGSITAQTRFFRGLLYYVFPKNARGEQPDFCARFPPVPWQQRFNIPEQYYRS